ncbi:hypothetical protein L3Y34_017568 [Caenorhabditis briggsae]|uniref:Uncharacterized protein n=1 Tax=Caenorhabditis briggsae TaxID=6238 RepID=A0AAE9DHU3_CAEBR|nr:hypothetical protein L3Y34_017568 [Caenorhabditis briggsae]
MASTVPPVDSPCAPPELHESFTSPIMLFCHSFMSVIIFASFYLSYRALKTLKKQNVFGMSTKILLQSSIINGVVHQATTAFIRFRALYRAIRYFHDPCSIQFSSASCVIEGLLYYHTNLFCSVVCLSLFLDRLASTYIHKFYKSVPKKAAYTFIVIQILIPALILYWVFYDAIYIGYVPLCNYPPKNSNEKFYIVNATRICIFWIIAAASIVHFYQSFKHEKRIIHEKYDTNARYNAFENLLCSRAVCWIICIQAVCLAGTSAIPSIFNIYRGSIPIAWFHGAIAFATGLTYANFFVPIVITFETNRIIRLRRSKIQSLRRQKNDFDYHHDFKTLLESSYKKIHPKTS